MTLKEFLMKEVAARQANQQAAREAERIADPRRYAARLRAEAHRKAKCPINKFARDFFPPMIEALHTVEKRLQDTRAKTQAMRQINEG